MNKKIAFLLGEVTGKLQETVMKALKKRALELGYDVVYICTYGSYNADVYFATGEKACAYIVDYSEFDGVIVSEDFFNLDGMADEIYDHLKEYCRCPVVYLRTVRDGFFSVLVENHDSIKLMTNHFINDHGFKDICYMSGKQGFMDSNERLNGFLDAMKEANLTVSEHDIFHGDYWREKGKAAVDWFLEGRDKYPEAIVCANDFMAMSVIDELKKRGIRVPEDICVSGFDYVEESRIYEPSLTSMEVDYEKIVVEALNIIDGVNMAIHQEKITRIMPNLKLHKSCGCGDQWHAENITEYLKKDYYNIYVMHDVMSCNMDYQDALDEEEYLEVAKKYFGMMKCEKGWLCLCDLSGESQFLKDSQTTFSDRMILKRIFNKYGQEVECLNVPFDKGTLLPMEYLGTEETSFLLVFSIHFKNHLYGYMVCTMPDEDWPDIFTQGYLMSLATALENASVRSELASTDKIKSLYQKDSLTGLFNRRGFDSMAKEMFSNAQNSNKNIHVLSIDMDFLNEINEKFGHTEGDRAIKKVADTISSIIYKDELVGRVGGDEFYVLLNDDVFHREELFEKQLTEAFDKINHDNAMYPISVSMGCCSLYDHPASSLQSCMQIAEWSMYDKKRKKLFGM